MRDNDCHTQIAGEPALEFHRSADEVVEVLRRSYAETALFAFGQTPFWDEPMKAIVRRMLDAKHPEGRMIIGVHDADYFSRNAPGGPEGSFEIFPRNDNSTQTLWVASGEVSCLFGCEQVPRRMLFTEHGVQLEKLARAYHGDKGAFIDAATEAWGWRGVARRGQREPAIADVPAHAVLPKLLEALEWAERESIKYLPASLKEPSPSVVTTLMDEMKRFAEEHPGCTLSDLFQHVLPLCYRAVLPHMGPMEVSSTSAMFRFNRSTACLPRFRPLQLFLDPATAAAAREAYDVAVSGAQIYDLSHFPPGAIPFDVLVPGRGRGTLCILDDHVLIEMGQSLALDCAERVKSVRALAEVIERHLGTDVVLIGKAVTFAAMISSEFVFLLNKEGSRYVAQTRAMVAELNARGIPLALNPVLRMEVDVWSALRTCEFPILLPRHLVSAFQAECVSAKEFGAQWKRAVRDQRRLLKTLRTMTSPEELMAFLAHTNKEHWLERMRQYVEAHNTLLGIHCKAEQFRSQAEQHREESRTLRKQVQELQRRKGEFFRQFIRPLQDKLHGLAQHGLECPAEVRFLKSQIREKEKEREKIEREIQQRLARAQQEDQSQRACRQRYRALETGEEARAARRILAQVERELEKEKLRMVRDALLTTLGLPFTAHRPAAWWLPLADPSGGWTRACARAARFYFEEFS